MKKVKKFSEMNESNKNELSFILNDIDDSVFCGGKEDFGYELDLEVSYNPTQKLWA